MKEIVLILPRENIVSDNSVYHEKQLVNYNNMNILNNKNFEVYREPLGIESMAASLRSHGFKVKLFFCDLEEIDDYEIVSYVRRNGVKIVGLSVLFNRYLEHALILGKKIKKFDIFVFMGGPSASFCAEKILRYSKNWLDGILVGEGEITIVKIAKKIYSGVSYREEKGIVYLNWENDKIIWNEMEQRVPLYDIPAPDHDYLDRACELGYRPNIASVYTSRGCAGQCIFCTGAEFQKFNKGKCWNYRNPESVVDEIQAIIEKYNIRYFYICDDNFYGYGNDALTRIDCLIDLLVQKKIKARFHFEMRTDKVTEHVLYRLRRAGFIDVLLGIESGSQAMLDRWKKGVTVSQNTNAINLVRKCGLNLKAGYILFDADTSYEELKENIEFIYTTRLFDDNNIIELLNPMQIFCGSKQEKKIKKGKLSEKEIYKLDEKEFVYAISANEYEIGDSRVKLFWDACADIINEISILMNGKYLNALYMNWEDINHRKALIFLKAYKAFLKGVPQMLHEVFCEIYAFIETGKEIEKKRIHNIYLNYLERYFPNGIEVSFYTTLSDKGEEK